MDVCVYFGKCTLDKSSAALLGRRGGLDLESMKPLAKHRRSFEVIGGVPALAV